MGVDSFKITFNKPERKYYHGDTLGVVIHIFTKDGFKLNSITVTLRGTAKTSWTENYGRSSTTYNGIEPYFCRKFTLFGKPQGSAAELPPGEYTYMFAFVIPEGLPPSFEGEHGSIRYDMIVALDRPWKFNRTLNERFNIVSVFDLNKYPTLRETGGTLMEKEFCGCINTGNVIAVVRIPYRAFVPGQIIPLKIQIENNSNSNISDIYVSMLRRDSFHMAKRIHSTQETKTIKRAQSSGMKVKAKSSFGYYLPYKVPKVPICNLMECGIIDVIYLLEFEFKFSGIFAFAMKGRLPFYVGNMPLENVEIPEDFPIINEPHMNTCEETGIIT